MNALLDTCTLLWWLTAPERLSDTVRPIIEDRDNTIWVSSISAWEIATKHRLGRLPEADVVVSDLDAVVANEGFTELVPTMRDGLLAGRMGGDHKDPFDRFLAAQAIRQDVPILSPDAMLDRFPVQRIW